MDPKARLLLPPLLVLFCARCGEQGPTKPNPIDGKAALRHVKAMVDLGPRPSGSETLRKCRDYIVGELRKLRLVPRVDAFHDREKAPEVGSFFNIQATIPGTRKGEKRILVLGSHYDTKLCSGHPVPGQNFTFVGANDGGSSSGLLLELARHFTQHPLPVNLMLVWFDGEESIPWDWGRGERALFGSKRCVEELNKKYKPLAETVRVMVLLDMVGHKDLNITEDIDASHSGLRAVFKETSRNLGYGKYFFRETCEVTDDHIPFYNRFVKTIDLIQFDRKRGDWWHTPKDDMNLLSARSLGIVGHVVAEALPRICETFYQEP